MEQKTVIRQGNEDHVNVTNLIHKSLYTFARAPLYTYHCILCVG